MYSRLDGKWLNAFVWAIFLTLSSIMVLHVCLIGSWGIGTFPSIDNAIIAAGESGVFHNHPLVDADGRPSMLRYARSPAGRLLHFLPAGLWSVIAPLQVSSAFRSKYRAMHRRLGRLFIGMSVCISLGLPFLIYSRATKVEYGVVHGGFVLAADAYFLATGLLAIYHAKGKRLSRHRVWILRHLAIGYSVHLQRLLGQSYFVVGYLRPHFNDHTQEGSALRGVVFMAYMWVSVAISVGSMEVWLRHTRDRGVAAARLAPADVGGKKVR